MKLTRRQIIITASIFFALAILGGVVSIIGRATPIVFSGQRAFRDVNYQVSLGPRIPGNTAHAQTIDYIYQTLKKYGWELEIQEVEVMGQPLKNVIAKRGSGDEWIILGAHFDTRRFADRDPNPQLQYDPVPGANDGASGVAVLLELGRVLPKELDKQIWLVFFDGEDQGEIPTWDWILGSKGFAASLSELPDAAVIVDMVGDADLQIYQETNSDPELTAEIWKTARQAGYGKVFIDEEKYSILDDHFPFLKLGIPAVDIIDFDYPHWHTTADTPDKTSPESLSAVGITLYNWLLQD